MGRARRRLLAREEKRLEKDEYANRQIIINKELAQWKAEIREEAGNLIAGTMYASFILALRVGCGFGRKRILRVLDLIAGTANDINSGKITLGDLKDYAETQGILIQFDVDHRLVKCNIYERQKELPLILDVEDK